MMTQRAIATIIGLLLPSFILASVPPTPERPVSDVYHGIKVTDPYRWMEDMQSSEFKYWLKAQADHASSVLKDIRGRKALRERLDVLADAAETTGGYEQAGGKVFFLKRVPGERNRKLWVREGLNGAERMLVDPDAIPQESGHHAIDWYSAAPDGKLIAIGISPGGSENSVLRILNVESGEFLAEAITRTGLNEPGVAWLPDSPAFIYNRHPEGERYNKSAIYLHHVGSSSDQDRPLFGYQIDKRRKFTVPDLPYAQTNAGSPWVIAEVLHGDASERSYWITPVGSIGKPDISWRKIIGPKDKVTHAVLSGSHVYAVSQRNASRRELIEISLIDNKRTTIIPASNLVLQQPVAAGTRVLVKALDAGVSQLLAFDKKKRTLGRFAFPFEGNVREVNADGDQVLVRLEGWTRSPEVFAIEGNTVASTTLQKPVPVDMSGVDAKRVMVKSHDGVQVPLTILTQKNSPLDGQRPTILSGYGAYGISMEPRFSTTRLAWLERGGIQAICHVRGGGELGEEWHRGGYILTKQNTVSDFIACADWLISNRYTSANKLAGTGGSAGGITIGGAITQRPELFAAAQSAVGVSDMLRMELTPNGAPNVAEFGTVKNPAQFKAMYALSPYHRVVNGKTYPAVIVTTGANDPRVDAWMPGKMAARLQAANQQGKPVLLRVDFDAGHGMGSTVKQSLDEVADVWSFFLWQMGDPAFSTP